MTDAEFFMSFVGLLFGLALANIANHLAQAWQNRRQMPIGYAPIAYGLTITFFVAANFLAFSALRDVIALDLRYLLIGLGGALPMIFAARAILPPASSDYASIEQYYIAARHELLSPFIVVFIVFLFGDISNPSAQITDKNVLMSQITRLPLLLIPALLMLTQKPVWHRIGLTLLCVYCFAVMVMLG